MSTLNPLLMLDGYKTDHRRQYPEGTEYVYSNMTPRKSRLDGVDFSVFFGLQYFLKEYLIDGMQKDFFERNLYEVTDEYQRVMNGYLGFGAVKSEHIGELHSLGYLPIKIKALPEGTRVPMGVPYLTIENTHPQFFWLTNQLETILSASLWQSCTSATLAYLYRLGFDSYNRASGVPLSFSRTQGHDFSFRGMSSLESAMLSGAAHLTSFTGTDTIPAIAFLNDHYHAELNCGCSVPATEHSVMCMGGPDDELETYRRLIKEVYPSGIVSIVSDTWDFWSIMTTGIRELHDDIMSRNGCVVFRPDSGDPEKILCGDPYAPMGSPERAGAYRLLIEEFGAKTTNLGFHALDPHVGLIYGDSITLERQKNILGNLRKQGFASDVVLGIGSYTYQHNTRDTFGHAVKATWGVVNGEEREIFKSPKTDNGEKRSARGLLQVYSDTGTLKLKDRCTKEEAEQGWLKTVFENGRAGLGETLEDIRHRLHGKDF